MKKLLKSFAGLVKDYLFSDLKRAACLQEKSLILLARLSIDRIKALDVRSGLAEAEFSVFSQWGEDGIIQFLLQHIPIEERSFVEFGVEDYTEANTRFLLVNNNWRGLVIDGNPAAISRIRTSEIYWRHDLTAVCQFLTRQNINEVIENAGFSGDIGLLSIDIDGNDYWIWQAIDAVKPRIVICEYNSLFGVRYAVTIPYTPDFCRTKAHYSNLYFGASLPALCRLAEAKGYDFVGSNSVGTNAFFVRKDLNHPFNRLSAEQGYVASTIRESRDQDGRLTYISGDERRDLIKHLEVYNVDSGTLCILNDLW